MPLDLTDSFTSLVRSTATAFVQPGGSLSASLTSGAMNAAAIAAADQPLVRVNRARAAAVVDYGYGRLEIWEAWRPWLFAASTGVAMVSGLMLWKRKKVPEAWYTYMTTGGASAAVAYLTRPSALRAAPAPLPVSAPGQPPSDAPPVFQQVLGWLDNKVDYNHQTRPGWEATTWSRVARDLGFGTIEEPASIFFTRGTM